ncbi:MAG: hypothetical protein ACPL1K_02150 [Candidatus Kryptoniota bacterium]
MEDPRPSTGFRVPLPDGGSLYLRPNEFDRAAKVAKAQYLLGINSQEIEDAMYSWVL